MPSSVTRRTPNCSSINRWSNVEVHERPNQRPAALVRDVVPPKDQRKHARQEDVIFGHDHLTGDNVDRIVLARALQHAQGALAQVTAEPLGHALETDLGKTLHAFGEAAERGQALHARDAVQCGEPDIP
jgi:hypothetical protein